MTDNDIYPNQVNPDHYNGDSLANLVEEFDLNPWEFSILKYICRTKPNTPRIQDLEKARWYLNREIKRLSSISDANVKDFLDAK